MSLNFQKYFNIYFSISHSVHNNNHLKYFLKYIVFWVPCQTYIIKTSRKDTMWLSKKHLRLILWLGKCEKMLCYCGVEGEVRELMIKLLKQKHFVQPDDKDRTNCGIRVQLKETLSSQ